MPHRTPQAPDASKAERTDDVRVYRVRSDGEWATIAVGGWKRDDYHQGELLIHSSFGTWAHYWGNMGVPIDQFLCRTSADYLLGKLLGEALEEFDREKTRKAFIGHLLDDRRHRRLSAEKAREAFDMIDGDFGYMRDSNAMCEALTTSFRWLSESPYNIDPDLNFMLYLQEPWGAMETRISTQARGFWNELWPHFIARLKEEANVAVG